MRSIYSWIKFTTYLEKILLEWCFEYVKKACSTKQLGLFCAQLVKLPNRAETYPVYFDIQVHQI